MISKGEHDDLIIHLGEGDVLISTGRQADREFENEVIFSQDDKPHPIGAYTEKHAGEPSSVLNSPVRLQFLKVESVDVVLERLHRVRSQMVQALGEPDKAVAT